MDLVSKNTKVLIVNLLIVGGVFSFRHGKDCRLILEKNLITFNSASINGVVDFDYVIGISYLMENIYINNFGYSYEGNKIGSGAVGAFRGSHENINFLLFEKFIFNWAEAQGKIVMIVTANFNRGKYNGIWLVY